jgi:hypothetical protein
MCEKVHTDWSNDPDSPRDLADHGRDVTAARAGVGRWVVFGSDRSKPAVAANLWRYSSNACRAYPIRRRRDLRNRLAGHTQRRNGPDLGHRHRQAQEPPALVQFQITQDRAPQGPPRPSRFAKQFRKGPHLGCLRRSVEVNF